MEPCVGLSHIHRDRFALQCSLCGRRGGACIQCEHGNCLTAFHVTCAQYHGLAMDMCEQRPAASKHNAASTEEHDSDGELEMRVFCERHMAVRLHLLLFARAYPC